MCFVNSSVLLLGHKAARGHRETLGTTGGGPCQPEQQGWWWAHKSVWAGFARVYGTGFHRERWGGYLRLACPAQRSCCQAATARPPPASVHPTVASRALWSPLMEDVWLLCPLLNPGSDLQGRLCNPNITDTWRRWKAAGVVFHSRLLPAISVPKCVLIPPRDLCTDTDRGPLFRSCNTVGVRPQILQPLWLLSWRLDSWMPVQIFPRPPIVWLLRWDPESRL